MSVFNSAISSVKSAAFVAALLLTVVLAGCNQAGTQPNERAQADGTDGAQIPAMQPRLDASPVATGDGNWRVLTAEEVTFTVIAPGARQVKLLYSPVVADDQAFEIETLDVPDENGVFRTQLKPPADFAGDMWAEVAYADGTTRETEPIALVARDAVAIAAGQSESSGANASGGEGNNSTDARAGNGQPTHALNTSGGTITHNRLQANQPDVRIAINIPAFRLTLWQNDKPVKTYEIGIGKKSHPLPSGDREASQVIFNPNWIPPNSTWVRQMRGVNPGERITADDPRNPLGKIKIPLGNAYLIHEAAKPSDIGSLVSHGCARVLTEDLFDLAEQIITARSLPMSQADIERAKNGTERIIQRLETPIPVIISYETQVIEDGVLHLYPDVYDRNMNTVENLRALLESNDINAARLDDQTLKEMLARASMTEKFSVRLDDIKSGRALTAGRTQSLTEQSAERNYGGDSNNSRDGSSARRRSS